MIGDTAFKTFALPCGILGLGAAAGLIMYNRVEKTTELRIRRAYPNLQNAQEVAKTAEKVSTVSQKIPTAEKAPLVQKPPVIVPEAPIVEKKPKPPKKKPVHSSPFDQPPMGYSNNLHKNMDPFSIDLPDPIDLPSLYQAPMA